MKNQPRSPMLQCCPLAKPEICREPQATPPTQRQSRLKARSGGETEGGQTQSWTETDKSIKLQEGQNVHKGEQKVHQEGQDVQQRGHDLQQRGHDVQQGGHDVQQGGHDVQQGGQDVQQDGFSSQGRVFTNYADIHKERQTPFKKKTMGIMEMMENAVKNMRVVSKLGKINTHRHQKKQLSVIVKDLFISSIHLSWSWTCFNFFGSYFLSWFLFAIIWYLIGLAHGDFKPEPDHEVCVENMVDFTSAFLFSIETQHTIGYGGRQTTSSCPHAIILMSVQSIYGVFLTACVTGIVFAKFTKPTHRAKTILFSKNALITMRNGAFYLLCRVADLQPTHLIESHISAYVVRREVTEEGEEIPHHLFAIEFGTDLDGTQDFFQLFWPIVLSHRIDEASPLWSVSPTDLITEKFEIILTMEGTTPETGNNLQVRTSYLPSEILWGYKFEHSCVHFNNTLAKYEVSFDTLNTIIKDNTPCLSPRAYEEQKKSRQVEATNQSN